MRLVIWIVAPTVCTLIGAGLVFVVLVASESFGRLP